MGLKTMDILSDMSDDEVRTLANSETPKPMAGVWVLTAPDGQTWTADSPLRCATAELSSRVPPQVALARIRRASDEPEGLIEPVWITDRQFYDMATRSFPRWREDIQEKFVAQLGRAIEREIRAAPAAPAPAPDGWVLAAQVALEDLEQATAFASKKARDRHAQTLASLRAALATARPAAQEQKP